MPDDTKIVMYDGPEAAVYKTGVSGWVSRLGRWWGDDEHMARWEGCTHKKCACGEVTEKCYTICKNCRDKKDDEKFFFRPRAEWDGVAMLFSDSRNTYYASLGDAEDDLEEGETIEELRLIICEPNYARTIDLDYFCDQMAEDQDDLPVKVVSAVEAFNKAVAGVILSWSPGKFALATDK